MQQEELLLLSLPISFLVLLVAVIWALLPTRLYKKAIILEIGRIFSVLAIFMFMCGLGVIIWFLLTAITCHGGECEGFLIGLIIFFLPALGITVLSGFSAFFIASKSKKVLRDKSSYVLQGNIPPKTKIILTLLILGLFIAIWYYHSSILFFWKNLIWHRF